MTSSAPSNIIVGRKHSLSWLTYSQSSKRVFQELTNLFASLHKPFSTLTSLHSNYARYYDISIADTKSFVSKNRMESWSIMTNVFAFLHKPFVTLDSLHSNYARYYDICIANTKSFVRNNRMESWSILTNVFASIHKSFFINLIAFQLCTIIRHM